MRLPIPPVFATSSNGNQDAAADGGMDGVKEVLAGWVMRYLPPLRCVVLSFEPNPRFLHPRALFDANACPFETQDPPASTTNGTTGTSNDDDEEKQKLEAGELVRLKTLPMIDGSGFTLADVEWKGLGWKPTVGMKLGPYLPISSSHSLL